jgi:hypothetical protein
MSKVIVDMGVSPDGLVAGPNAGPHNALGDGGHRVHRRAYDLEAWRERLGLAGGRTNRDDEVVREANDLVGAHVVGRRTFDEGGELAGPPALPGAGLRLDKPREGTVGKAGRHDLRLRRRRDRGHPGASNGGRGRQGRQVRGRRERRRAVPRGRARRRDAGTPRPRAARRRGALARRDRSRTRGAGARTGYRFTQRHAPRIPSRAGAVTTQR